MSIQRAILQTLATKAARGHDRSTELLIKLAGQAAKEGDAAIVHDLWIEGLPLLTMYIADIAAGNKAVDGSFPDEPTEYKEPPA